MTAATLDRVATPSAGLPGMRVSLRRVTASEWVKFRSLKSTVWTLFVGVALTVGIGSLFSWVAGSQYATGSASDRASFNPVTSSLNGVTFAQLALGVLGVLFMTGEYSTGMIRSSLTVVPRRLPILWGKIAVYAGAVGVLSLIASFVSFFIGQAILNSYGLGVSLSAPHALRSIVGSAVYLVLAGIIGLAIGGILRSSAAGITSLVGLLFVIPPLLQLLPASYSNHIAPYLPAAAGQALWAPGSRGAPSDALGPWTGIVVMALWAVVATAICARRLSKTDA